MSRVTIKELYWEINEDKYASNVWDGYKDIEVVPRKMVEMIIEKCRQDVIKYNHDSEEAACIEQYAESLLRQFEEEIE